MARIWFSPKEFFNEEPRWPELTDNFITFHSKENFDDNFSSNWFGTQDAKDNSIMRGENTRGLLKQ